MRLLRRIRDLEARIDELEGRLDQRAWELPPANRIDLPDLPDYPDYCTGVVLEDEYDGWNPTSYL